ncbi:DUF4232 domain-containing protein [Actinacidiphila guanduensis]|uniref:DUF4232 domain-containing protein n=1 Tax=Actinacidiphila guanduensis TaxID=310781 RepID=A0A1H0P9R9_9ACTN|nr:DUF4232 domain-containing protein [Actinacidiphila guanduensis]SDP01438.1 Protein of unknown function [Actinacidiphila guanduensis]
MRSTTVRRGVPALLLVAAGLTLTACGSDDTASTSSSAPATSTTAQAAPTSTGTTDTGGSTAPTTAGNAPAQESSGQSTRAAGSTTPSCATSNLKVTADGFSSGAGSTTFQLVFQNTGSAPCTLSGFPGVSFVKIHNTQMGKAAERTSTAPTIVTLIPNAHAYADVRTVNGQGGYSAAQCDLQTVPTLRVYPPNQKESTNIPWNRQECVGSGVQNLQVGPVHSNR